MPNLIDFNLLCPVCMHKHAAPQNVCAHCKTDKSTFSNKMEQLPVGTILGGKYYIGGVIGQGGFGITYRAWDLSLDVKLAVKEYFPGNCVFRAGVGQAEVMARSSETEDFFSRGREQFFSEARSLAKFTGLSGVVGVRDFFQENGTAYIVMDYAEGRTLKDIMDKEKRSFMDVLEMLRPLISDLGVMHEQNLIHRDIKPENIMVSPADKAVLLDFGAARAYMGNQKFSTYSMTLTHGYAPVEQYQNGQQGPWTDVYAMCATLYELATGKQPTTSLERLMNKKPLTKPNELGANLPKNVEDAIMAGLALQKDERTQSMGQLYQGLYASAPAAQPVQVQKKGGLPVWLAAVLAVGMLAFAGLWVMEAMAPKQVKVVETANLQGSAAVLWTDGPLDFGGNQQLESAVRLACGVETGAVLPSDAAKATELKLDGVRLVSTEFLRQFTGLTALSLRETGISDLAVLEGMENLEKLDLSGNAVTSLEPLRALTKLTWLWAADNRIADAAPLKALTGLEVLDLSGNQLADLSALEGCTGMRRLWVHGNRITSLQAMGSMQNLTMLSAGDNQVEDLSPLGNCTQLDTLYLYANKVKDLTPLYKLGNLRVADLHGNSALTDSALAQLQQHLR